MRFAGLLLALALPATAQVRPMTGPGDPRLQTAVYDPNQVVQLAVAPGYQLTLVLEASEAVETVALGEAGGWQVTPSKRGDALFIKASGGARQTNMSVVTATRTYMFELIPATGPSNDVPYRVQFTYPQASQPPAQVQVVEGDGRYRLSGRRAIQPSAMSDDGVRTYIEWAPDQALPAVFMLDDAGQEMPADGHVRDGRYTIDGIRQRYIFRLGRDIARASRIESRK